MKEKELKQKNKGAAGAILQMSVPISQFVRSSGGISPAYGKWMRAGEIRRITEMRKGFPPGMINSQSVLTLEEMVTRCHEAGYIWEDSMDLFFDALEADVAACANGTGKRVVPLGERDDYTLQLEKRMEEDDTLVDEHAQLWAENQRLKRQVASGLFFSVTKKGVAVRCPGLSVVLPKEQWSRLLSQAEVISEFLETVA